MIRGICLSSQTGKFNTALPSMNKMQISGVGVLFESLRVMSIRKQRVIPYTKSEKMHAEEVIPHINRTQVRKVPQEIRDYVALGLEEHEALNLKNSYEAFSIAKEKIRALSKEEIESFDEGLGEFIDSCISEVQAQVELLRDNKSSEKEGKTSEELSEKIEELQISVSFLFKQFHSLKNVHDDAKMVSLMEMASRSGGKPLHVPHSRYRKRIHQYSRQSSTKQETHPKPSGEGSPFQLRNP